MTFGHKLFCLRSIHSMAIQNDFKMFLLIRVDDNWNVSLKEKLSSRKKRHNIDTRLGRLFLHRTAANRNPIVTAASYLFEQILQFFHG